MRTDTSSLPYHNAFNHWLRTGRWVEVPEQKGKDNGGGNPNHDPENGQFTFGPGGPRQSEPRRQLADIKPASGSKKPVHAAIPKPAQPPKASPKNIAHGTNASPGQIRAEHLAVEVISTRLGGIGVTPAARDQLDKFLSGDRNPDDNMVYLIGTAGSNEMKDSLYAIELNAHVQKDIARRNGWAIPDGNYLELTQSDVNNGADISHDPNRFMPFRSAGPLEYILSLGPTVTLADVVGSFTNRIEVYVKDGLLTYKGVNQTSLGSFAENNFRHNINLGPKIQDADIGSGPLATIQQTIYFQFPIKRKYSKNRRHHGY